MNWINIEQTKKCSWIGINESNEKKNFVDMYCNTKTTMFQEDKKDNDATGREFEWKVVKQILKKLGKCPKNFVPTIDANGYSNGNKIDDDTIDVTSSQILSIPEIARSKIANVSHIGEDNGNSHGDIKITTTSGKDIGVELKYVSGGSGTWHNTKGTLLNKYLKDDRFTSPKDVMDTEKDDISEYQLGEGLVFGSNASESIRDEMHAILEPFHQNGIDISDPEMDVGGWGGNMSDKLSHKFRHGFKGSEKDDVDMDEIKIQFIGGKWCANGIPISKSHQKYWSKNDKSNEYIISAPTVYKTVLVPLGRLVMRKVVNQHLALLENNDRYINQLFTAFLLKVTAKSLVSKLPNYLVAY